MTVSRLTNKLNLPQPIVEAVLNDSYSAGGSDFSATSLLMPARMKQLVRMHPEECVEDVADILYRLQGQAVHTILERAAKSLDPDEYIVERRFFSDYIVDGQTYKISAQIDLFENKKFLLQDYKTSSVAALSRGLKEEHRLQVNLQAELMRREGHQVERAEVVGIFRDWSAERAANDPDYPQTPVVVLEVPLMPPQEVDEWVVSRVKTHTAAGQASFQDLLPQCTDEETWARVEDDGYSVTKRGNTRASVIVSTQAEADDYISSRQKDQFDIELRLGAAARCKRHCPARFVCDQWRLSPRNPANRGGKLAKDNAEAALPDDLEWSGSRR